MYTISDLFDVEHTQAKDYLAAFKYPWEALGGLTEWIKQKGEALGDDYTQITDGVWAHNTAKIAPTALLCPPCIIGENTEIRHCAFIRGGVLIGNDCVIGNSVELKNAIVFDGAQIPHYNYVGDSIIGYKAHMGAGSITSNVKSDKTPVVVKDGQEAAETGRKKVGAMLGDFAEIGCNSVLNPGSVIGRGASVYPLSCVRGTVEANGIYKTGGIVVQRKKEIK